MPLIGLTSFLRKSFDNGGKFVRNVSMPLIGLTSFLQDYQSSSKLKESMCQCP